VGGKHFVWFVLAWFALNQDFFLTFFTFFYFFFNFFNFFLLFFLVLTFLHKIVFIYFKGI